MASSQPPAHLEGSSNARREPRSVNAALRVETTSESSDDGLRMSPAAARRFARRHLHRNSPTPDLVTSLVRPPSPDTFFVTPQAHTRARQETLVRAGPHTGGATSLRRSGPALPPHLSSLDLPKRYGGNCVFDMYALTYVVEPDWSLLCPICHDPLVDPVTTPCDHTFCYRCLRRSIASSPSGTACPIDREPLSWLDCSSAARLIRTQLSNLVVKCPNHNRGCNKTPIREAVEAHAINECLFRDYICPSSDCGKKLRLKPTDDKCQHRQEPCTYCDEEVEAADRQFHLLSCLKSKTRCESCWQLICRTQLALHHEMDCDGVEIGCPYQDLGCPALDVRANMNGHAVACAFHPETPSGIIIRSQRELLQSYEGIGDQLQNMHVRQDEASSRIDEIMTSLSRRSGSDGLIGDNRTMQDLDAGFEEVHQNLTQLEARQSMWTMNQVMPIREEVTELRNNINMVRMHVNWLLNRSREEGRTRAANNTAATASLRRDGTGDTGPVLPERRRSSGADADIPRL